MSIEGVCSTKLCIVDENMKRAHIAAVATSWVATSPNTCGAGSRTGRDVQLSVAACYLCQI